MGRDGLSRNFLIMDGLVRAVGRVGRLLSEKLDLLLAISSFVVFRPFVHVMLTIFQHSIDESGQPMSHGRDGFRSAEFAAQAPVLRSEVFDCSVGSRLPDAVRWLRG